jgi:hypothetical protein
MLLSFERPFVGAFAFVAPRATLLHRNGLVWAVLPESDWIMGRRTIEVPQELGSSCRFLGKFPGGDTGSTTPGLDGALVRRGANTTSATEVPPSEGNEVRWDERQEVIAS